jgi:hypothetical protein
VRRLVRRLRRRRRRGLSILSRPGQVAPSAHHENVRLAFPKLSRVSHWKGSVQNVSWKWTRRGLDVVQYQQLIRRINKK